MAKSSAKFVALSALALLIAWRPAFADDRPRDITLLLRTPSKIVFSDGDTMNSPLALRIFFALDGTAFIEVDKEQVIELPPAKRSGSMTTAGGDRWTAEISGSPDALNVDLVTYQSYAPDAPSVSFNMRVQYSLRLSREECIVTSGNANVWIEGKLPKPLSVSITKGTPTCDMLPGKHLKTTGSGA